MIERNYLMAAAAVLTIAAVMVLLTYWPGDAGDEGGQGGHDGNETNVSSHLGTAGEYQTDDFDPSAYLKAWNFNDLPDEERGKFYRETNLSDGTMLREYWFYAEDGRIEIAPGVFYDAWTYNGQVPAPTIRASEGDTIRIYFRNDGSKPHTMHFHGFHEAAMDGSLPEQFVNPGGNFTYEFKAEPFGLHLYHCHSTPLKDHISRGLYGVYIVDPKEGREPANEMVMLLNAFDTDFDGENEVYAVNTRAFHYNMHPIRVKKGELVRIYLVNIVENDPINSLHTHANFFYEYRTGTELEPNAYTDIIELGQAERSIIEMRFNNTGRYMFHAHQTEFTELGWMGMFDVREEGAGNKDQMGVGG